MSCGRSCINISINNLFATTRHQYPKHESTAISPATFLNKASTSKPIPKLKAQTHHHPQTAKPNINHVHPLHRPPPPPPRPLRTNPPRSATRPSRPPRPTPPPPRQPRLLRRRLPRQPDPIPTHPMLHSHLRNQHPISRRRHLRPTRLAYQQRHAPLVLGPRVASGKLRCETPRHRPAGEGGSC